MTTDDHEGIADAGVPWVQRILAALEPEDLELLTPPAAIWLGIEDSLASDRARRPPARVVGSTTVVEYRIDAQDRVRPVGEGWASFARENDAPELAAPAPDRDLWSYFDRQEIRELWQVVVGRVRSTQTEATIPLRCDAPHARRWFEMTVTPEADRGVRFVSVLAYEETRPAVALLDPRATRDAGASVVALCSWCGRGRHGDVWLDIESLVRSARLLERDELPPISHGICGPCRREMSAELLVTGAVGEAPD
ncbi:MAG: hypothetical protein RIB98_00205 [Acidimicrobiales bacterium]